MPETSTLYTEQQIRLARYAKALSHPVRVYIMEYLVKNADQCFYSGTISDELPIARSTLSQHLSELKDAGLIQGEISAPYIRYCLDREHWKEAKQLFSGLFH
jgi:DNA-binding transcriptional ArsR family regulator